MTNEQNDLRLNNNELPSAGESLPPEAGAETELESPEYTEPPEHAGSVREETLGYMHELIEILRDFAEEEEDFYANALLQRMRNSLCAAVLLREGGLIVETPVQVRVAFEHAARLFQYKAAPETIATDAAQEVMGSNLGVMKYAYEHISFELNDIYGFLNIFTHPDRASLEWTIRVSLDTVDIVDLLVLYALDGTFLILSNAYPNDSRLDDERMKSQSEQIASRILAVLAEFESLKNAGDSHRMLESFLSENGRIFGKDKYNEHLKRFMSFAAENPENTMELYLKREMKKEGKRRRKAAAQKRAKNSSPHPKKK
ncbi:hypothetical protein QWJ34_07225 [Saccharibacillus sp. CPCC 101409]|uniref:hypothetical protein n=1 Tax=Saccharibacillus sp. CPCC 101409 TaxID=3058041 RepID=UPI00267319AD|nr:hypothetical protein [Saccharibacillus sp. CPCC 101409]MDO3409551.1 hypothetical protein [Saccharibacillus sp. CPCC 101409]